MSAIAKIKKSQQGAETWLASQQASAGKEGRFSADALIDAYFSGMRRGVEENKKALSKGLKLFSENLERAKSVCEEFFSTLKENRVNCSFVTLRAADSVNFDAIFVVPKVKFLAPDFDAVYMMALRKKNEVNTDTFKLYFSFMPLTRSIDERRMQADGFILKYGKKKP